MQAEYPPNAPWQHAPQQYPVMPVQPGAPQSGVVWLPPVANDRSTLDLRFRGGLGIFTALLVVGVFISAIMGSVLTNFVQVVGLRFLLLLGLGFSLILGIRMLLQPRRWSVVNQRRQWAAAYGSASGVPLAEPQPLPNIEALPVPFTIKLKRRWLFITFAFCLYTVLFFTLQLNSYSQEGWSLQQSLAHISTNWLLYFLFFLIPLALCFVGGSLPQSIEVTAQGLIVRHPLSDVFKSSFGPWWKWEIPWSDIRLFAIREGKPGAGKVRYEVSSPFKVVTFARIVRPRWWSLYRPAQPFGEYQTQVDALLAFISARTGLLLYDVR